MRKARRLFVARFRLAGEGGGRSDPPNLPQAPAPAQRANRALRTRLAMDMMQGTLGGRTFEMTAVAPDERLPLREETIWTFSNETGAMAMPHPIHIRFGEPLRFPDYPAERKGYESLTADLETAIRGLKSKAL